MVAQITKFNKKLFHPLIHLHSSAALKLRVWCVAVGQCSMGRHTVGVYMRYLNGMSWLCSAISQFRVTQVRIYVVHTSSFGRIVKSF